MPSAGATLTGNLGYFPSSDRLMQAMRWGVGTRLELGFHRLFSEFSYQNSTSRTVSTLLSDDGAEAMLGFRIGWGFSLLSGIRADMNDETLWGTAFALRFDGRVPLPQKIGIFTTPPKATEAPIIFNLALSQISHESALVTWETDETASTILFYGTEAPSDSITNTAMTTVSTTGSEER